MRVIRLSYGIRGFVRLARYGLKWLSMLTNKAKFKAKVLSFWTRHGLEATLDAFPVKRSTLFLWKQKIKQGNGNLESLNELSKAPRLKRRRLWSPAVIAEIRRLRLVYPNLGKEMDSIERREFGLSRRCDMEKKDLLMAEGRHIRGRLKKAIGGDPELVKAINELGALEDDILDSLGQDEGGAVHGSSSLTGDCDMLTGRRAGAPLTSNGGRVQ